MPKPFLQKVTVFALLASEMSCAKSNNITRAYSAHKIFKEVRIFSLGQKNNIHIKEYCYYYKKRIGAVTSAYEKVLYGNIG